MITPNSTDGLTEVIAALSSGPLLKVNELPGNTPKCSIFAIYEGGELLHVGRSRSTRALVRRDCMECGSHLAFKMTRHVTGYDNITYDGGPESKEALMRIPAFAAEYAKQVKRCANASVRLVEVEDRARRESLHTAARWAMPCPYNDPR